MREAVELAVSDDPDVVCLQELPAWSLSRLAAWTAGYAVAPALAAPPTLGPLPSTAEIGRVLTSLNAGLLRSAVSGQGNAILVNPGPGTVGSLGKNTIEGPSRFQLDMNLQKKFRLDERREFEFRSDVTNVLNHTVFAVPTTNINSASFGQIDSAGVGRQFTLGMRLNF